MAEPKRRDIPVGMLSRLTVLECPQCSALTWNYEQHRKHMAWHQTQVSMPDFTQLRTEVSGR